MYNVVMKEKILPEYWENTKYGELYYINNFIKDFQEKNLPHYIRKYRHSEKHPEINNADILVYGDSFFDFSRMVTIPERIADTLHQTVYYQRMFDDHRPVIYLQKDHYTGNEPKLLLYETAEIYLPQRFLEKHDTVLEADNRGILRKMMAEFRDQVFLKDGEMKYSVLLQRSLLTNDIYTGIATFKFRNLHYITESTPVYSLKYDIPWLFYSDDVNPDVSTFYDRYTDADINAMCDNIADVAAVLKRQYNLEFVFVPIPNKYTLYHNLVNNDAYSGFLPKIYEGLHKRNIPVVELYDVYQDSDEILFYGTDTHWNKKGMEIALNEVLKVITDDKLVDVPVQIKGVSEGTRLVQNQGK